MAKLSEQHLHEQFHAGPFTAKEWMNEVSGDPGQADSAAYQSETSTGSWIITKRTCVNKSWCSTLKHKTHFSRELNTFSSQCFDKNCKCFLRLINIRDVKINGHQSYGECKK